MTDPKDKRLNDFQKSEKSDEPDPWTPEALWSVAKKILERISNDDDNKE